MAQEIDSELVRIYQGPKFLGTQVILKAKNEFALNRALQEAKDAGLITSLIVDENHIMLPLFDGSPIVTAIGIGPCSYEQAKHITKRFELVR